jgi:prepilin peptidase CpaA
VVAIVASGGAASALVDLRTRRIPNALTFGFAALGIVLAALRLTPLTLVGSLAGFVVGLLVMLPGHLVGATGAGDVKLLAATGTLLGPTGVVLAFLYTALAGGVLAILVALSRGRLAVTLERTGSILRRARPGLSAVEHGSGDNRFAYAPAIAIGSLIAAVRW